MSTQKQAPFYLGTWHMESSGGPISAVVEWTFASDGSFKLRGYPELILDGRYSFKSESAEGVLLKVEQAKGHFESTQEILLKDLTPANSGAPKWTEISILNSGPFKKVTVPHF